MEADSLPSPRLQGYSALAPGWAPAQPADKPTASGEAQPQGPTEHLQTGSLSTAGVGGGRPAPGCPTSRNTNWAQGFGEESVLLMLKCLACGQVINWNAIFFF